MFMFILFLSVHLWYHVHVMLSIYIIIYISLSTLSVLINTITLNVHFVVIQLPVIANVAITEYPYTMKVDNLSLK